MNSRNDELVALLIDLQKIGERFSDTCSRMTSHELKASLDTIPDTKSLINDAVGRICDLILDYFPN